MASNATPASAAVPVPSLRQELRIERGASLANGAPTWTLFDPVRHAFFQLGRAEYLVFSHWAEGSLRKLRDEFSADGNSDEEIEETVNEVIAFSLENHLTLAPAEKPTAAFLARAKGRRKAWWRWAVDNYLFIRIPLVKPQRFLEKTIHWVEPLWSRAALVSFVILGILSIYLVSRQWDAFLSSFLYFFNVQGLIAYGLGLVAVKILHELGHAYTALRYGCSVPSMGLSFLVLMPVLYTDTTGAWRLTSRRKRLAIDCAGVSVELMVAVLATLAWALLPDGTLRSVAFILSTTSWTMSLLVNLNPFMRFDGYYALSDALGIPNLQPRAFALGRWRLRELLFNLGDRPPEEFSDRMRRTLIVSAWLTWAYRLILFIGIALLVYHLFFKLLGVILFIVEIAVFIARPVANELRAWWRQRDRIKASRRAQWMGAGLGLAFVLLLLPLDRHVSAPAVQSAVIAAPVVAGQPAFIDEVLVENGAIVRPGDPLFQLTNPEVARDKQLAEARIAALETRLSRGAADDRDLSNRQVLEGELAEQRQTLAALDETQSRLTLKAARAGRIVDLPDDLYNGRWIRGDEVLARIVSTSDRMVLAFVDEADRHRIMAGANGRFVPDDAAAPSNRIRLIDVSDFALERIDKPQLASTNGGPVPVDEKDGKLTPRSAHYRAELISERLKLEDEDFLQEVSGTAIVDAKGQSVVGRWIGDLLKVFRSEATLVD